MPTATINMLFCVHEATGTDLSVFEAIAALPEKLVAAEIGPGLVDPIKALPGVISAIDIARADPDDLYVTAVTEGDIDNAIWPGSGETVDMQAGQSVAPNISVEFTSSQNISLFDHDVSDDDLLGSVTMLAAEQGQGEIAKLARSQVESSYYYVVYTVE